MSTEAKDVEAKDAKVTVEELRDAVLTMEANAQASAKDETKKLEVVPKNKEVERLKAPEVPDQVKRVSGIAAAIHARREERARLTSDVKRLEVANERLDREGREQLDAHIASLRGEFEACVARLNSQYRMDKDLRQGQIVGRQQVIAKIDLSLEQLRKQLDAELGKLDPDRKVTA